MKTKWEEELRSQLQANHEMLAEVNTSWKDKVFSQLSIISFEVS